MNNTDVGHDDNIPLLAQYPEYCPLLLCSGIFGPQLLPTSELDRAFTPSVQIVQALVRAFRLNYNRTEPAGVDDPRTSR